MTRTACLVGIFTGLLVPAGAQAQSTPLTMAASASKLGQIAIRLSGTPGATVDLLDTAVGGGPLTRVTLPPSGSAELPAVSPWRCAVTQRSFSAHAQNPDGSTQDVAAAVRTPSCAQRLGVTLPRHARARRRAAISVVDRWRLGGLQVTVCIRESGQKAGQCHTLNLARGTVRGVAAFTPRRVGRDIAAISTAGYVTRRSIHVQGASGRLRVLAAGDSMMQILDSDIERRLTRLGPTTVSSDAHPSTGISKPFLMDWVARARTRTRAVHPDVTVMFLGANDGFPMRAPGGQTNQCCGAGWIAEYARRAGSMMRSYARNGAGLVYWLLLPAPRARNFRKVFGPVNRAVESAAKALPGQARVIDLRRTFTPHGRFRQSIRWHGHFVSVRQPDGVHLSLAGAKIAGEIVVAQMRRDGLIG